MKAPVFLLRELYSCLRGRPPLRPFLRAAVALASDVTLPPLRPKSTAAGFLRGIASNRQCGVTHGLPVSVGRHGPCDMRADLVVAGVAQGVVFRDLRSQVVGGEAVDLAARALRLLQQSAKALGVAGIACAKLVGGELAEEVYFRHAPIKPNRLGFVK